MPGTALVSLGASNFGDVPVPEKSHDTITWGTIIKLNKEDEKQYGYLLNREGYWRAYKDDAKIDPHVGQKKLCLIDIKDILGSSYEDTTSTDK